jgi:hypothetical protein
MDLTGTNYELRDDLELYNIKRNRKLAKPLDKDGYVRYGLYISGVKRGAHLHKLVAHKYHGPRPEGMVINHKDGNKLNNHPNNLEYITALENTAHAKENGLIPSGFDTHGSKLTVEKLLTIYTMYLSGKPVRKNVSHHFGLSNQGIVRICQGQCYGEIRDKIFSKEMVERVHHKRGLILNRLEAGKAEEVFKLILEGNTRSRVEGLTGVSVKAQISLQLLYPDKIPSPW